MHDYFSQFLMSVVAWLCWGLGFEFMFRRSKEPQKRAQRWYSGLAWLGITIWMVYSMVMWRRFG